MEVGMALYASVVFSKIEPERLYGFSFLRFESGMTVSEARSVQKFLFKSFTDRSSKYFSVEKETMLAEVQKKSTEFTEGLKQLKATTQVNELELITEDKVNKDLLKMKEIKGPEKGFVASLIKKKEAYLKAKERLEKLKELVGSEALPKFSEPKVLDLMEDKHDILRKLFRLNKENDEIQSYVVNGHIGRNSHWFMVMQRRTDLFVIDPVGFKTREDFFKKFVLIKDFNIVAMKNPLQYGGNDCEGFANILPNYFMRLFLFNSPYYSLDSVFADKEHENGRKKEYEEFNVCTVDLISLLRDGLSEVSFGSTKETTRLVENRNVFDSRFESIKGQIDGLKEIISAAFTNGQSFQKIFLNDLTLTRNLLEYLILNRKAETSDLVEANMAFTGEEKKFEAKQEAVEFVLSNKLIFSRILEESIEFSSVLLNTMEKYRVTQKEVTSFLKFVTSSNYNELIVKELIKKHKHFTWYLI